MVKLKIARVAAATVASAGLIAGFSGVAFADHSHNNHDQGSKTFTNTSTVSKNNVGVSNDTNQHASSGDAKVISTNSGDNHDNHDKNNSNSGTSGDAMTGGATNGSTSKVDVTVANNSGGLMGGSDSSSSNGLTVTNTKTVSVNNVNVSNSTEQNATSGDATVVGSHNSGDATTGDATNTSNSSVTVDVSN